MLTRPVAACPGMPDSLPQRNTALMSPGSCQSARTAGSGCPQPAGHSSPPAYRTAALRAGSRDSSATVRRRWALSRPGVSGTSLIVVARSCGLRMPLTMRSPASVLKCRHGIKPAETPVSAATRLAGARAARHKPGNTRALVSTTARWRLSVLAWAVAPRRPRPRRPGGRPALAR
jgi:hypothetical protein